MFIKWLNYHKWTSQFGLRRVSVRSAAIVSILAAALMDCTVAITSPVHRLWNFFQCTFHKKFSKVHLIRTRSPKFCQNRVWKNNLSIEMCTGKNSKVGALSLEMATVQYSILVHLNVREGEWMSLHSFRVKWCGKYNRYKILAPKMPFILEPFWVWNSQLHIDALYFSQCGNICHPSGFNDNDLPEHTSGHSLLVHHSIAARSADLPRLIDKPVMNGRRRVLANLVDHWWWMDRVQ